ncbi:MAG: MGMT family protein [SAR202 cluster bacterium]|nr:MGMT family protein [SAR202 cluster bacterium]
MTRWFDVFETPEGWAGYVVTGRGVRSGTLPQPSPEACILELGNELDGAVRSPRKLASLRDKVLRFLQGEPVDFSRVRLDIADAGPFHQAAWNATRTIPRGETRSYLWLAEQAGRPRAPRAAGQAMARNRVPIIVPCHRVIASDGSLGGYGGGPAGIALKRRLLIMEGAL